MFRRWFAVLATLLVAAAIGAAQGEAVSVAEYATVPLTEFPELHSTRPHFARLVATPDYGTALWLILDESRGTGTGYDLLYADFNYDGRIGETELVRGAARSIGVPVVDFPAFAVPAPEARQQIPHETPVVVVRWQGYQGTSFFLVTSILFVTDPFEPGRFWQYALNGQFRVAERPEAAPLTILGGRPQLQVLARPDANDPTATGIGLTVILGASFCDPRGPAGAPDASIVIRDQRGQIVHQASRNLDIFCFG